MRWTVRVWEFWFSILLLLTVATLWLTSYLIDRSPSFIAIGHRCFAFLRNGRIDLASDLDTSSRYPQPAVLDPSRIAASRFPRSGSIMLPGFDLRLRSLASGYLIWSLSLSLLIPIGVSALSVAYLFHRLRRRPGRVPSTRIDAA